MELKEFDEIEEGLYFLDKESRQIQAAKIFEIRRRFLSESLRKKEVNEISEVVDEYDKLYKEGKEINAYLLISKKPKAVLDKMFGKERE